MPSFQPKLVVKVAIDVIILIAFGLPILLFFVIGEPFHRGFFCSDPSIRYPYKDSTVTSATLYAIGTIIPVFAIVIIEYVHAFKCPVTEDYKKSRVLTWSLYRYLGVFLLGCAMSQLTADIAKYSLGRLRPHFIDVCKPNLDPNDCSETNFITDANCIIPSTSVEKHRLKEARLSFVSGHASFSAFTMFYLIIYLQARFHPRPFHLVRPLFQFLLFGITIYTCFTRVSDNKHHWQDVFMGFLNGVFFAFFTTLAVAGLGKRKRTFDTTSEEIKLCSLNPGSGTDRIGFEAVNNSATIGDV